MTVTDIKTDVFVRIFQDMRSEGWRKIEEYDGFDAWIDYGMVLLKRGDVTLKLEWTNWEEGSLDGPDDLVQSLKIRYALA